MSEIEKIKTILEEQNPEWWKVLTPKEKTILFGLMQGHTYTDLGKIHFLSIATIKTHSNNIFQKLKIFIPQKEQPGNKQMFLSMFTTFVFREIIKCFGNVSVTLDETIQAKKYRELKEKVIKILKVINETPSDKLKIAILTKTLECIISKEHSKC